MNVIVKDLNVGDERLNRLLAFLDGEDYEWSSKPIPVVDSLELIQRMRIEAEMANIKAAKSDDVYTREKAANDLYCIRHVLEMIKDNHA